MLRQRRYPKSNNLNNSLNCYANENFDLLVASNESNHFCPSYSKDPATSKRSGLKEITHQNNCKAEADGVNETGKAIKKSNVLTQNSIKESKCRENDNLFVKINELIRQEETGIPICHSFKTHKMVVNCPKERPYTSLSLRNRKLNQHSFQKGPAVLDFTPRQEPQGIKQVGRISTSRALMNYSKVYRNSSGERFKVKRDKQYLRNFALVSAQKVVLQEKQRKERRDLFLERSQGSSQIRRKTQAKAVKQKHRYAAQQDEYQIEGWEYFD